MNFDKYFWQVRLSLSNLLWWNSSQVQHKSHTILVCKVIKTTIIGQSWSSFPGVFLQKKSSKNITSNVFMLERFEANGPYRLDIITNSFLFLFVRALIVWTPGRWRNNCELSPSGLKYFLEAKWKRNYHLFKNTRLNIE